MQRPTAERRHNTQRVINRKTQILKYGWWYDAFEDWTHGGQRNRLNKGKIHCSCPLCAAKTKMFGPKISEYKQYEKLQSSLDEAGFDLKILPHKGW
jgi:hypothetical protein